MAQRHIAAAVAAIIIISSSNSRELGHGLEAHTSSGGSMAAAGSHQRLALRHSLSLWDASSHAGVTMAAPAATASSCFMLREKDCGGSSRCVKPCSRKRKHT